MKKFNSFIVFWVLAVLFCLIKTCVFAEDELARLDQQLAILEKKYEASVTNWSRVSRRLTYENAIATEASFVLSTHQITGPGKEYATDYHGRGNLYDERGNLVMEPYLKDSRQLYRWINFYGGMSPIDLIRVDFSFRIYASIGTSGIKMDPKHIVMKYQDEKLNFELGEYRLFWDSLLLGKKDQLLTDLPSVWDRYYEVKKIELGMEEDEWKLRGIRLSSSSNKFNYEFFGTILNLPSSYSQTQDKNGNNCYLPGSYSRYLYGIRGGTTYNAYKVEGLYLNLFDDHKSLPAGSIGQNSYGEVVRKPLANQAVAVKVVRDIGGGDVELTLIRSSFEKDLLAGDIMLGNALRLVYQTPNFSYTFLNVSPDYILYPAQSYGSLRAKVPLFNRQWEPLSEYQFVHYYSPTEISLDLGFDPRIELPYKVRDSLETGFMAYGQATPNRIGHDLEINTQLFNNSDIHLRLGYFSEVESSVGQPRSSCFGQVGVTIPITDKLDVRGLKGLDTISQARKEGLIKERTDFGIQYKISNHFSFGFGNTGIGLFGNTLDLTAETINLRKDITNIGVTSDTLFGGICGFNIINVKLHDYFDQSNNYEAKELWLNMAFPF